MKGSEEFERILIRGEVSPRHSSARNFFLRVAGKPRGPGPCSAGYGFGPAGQASPGHAAKAVMHPRIEPLARGGVSAAPVQQ